MLLSRVHLGGPSLLWSYRCLLLANPALISVIVGLLSRYKRNQEVRHCFGRCRNNSHLQAPAIQLIEPAEKVKSFQPMCKRCKLGQLLCDKTFVASLSRPASSTFRYSRFGMWLWPRWEAPSQPRLLRLRSSDFSLGQCFLKADMATASSWVEDRWISCSR